MFQTKRKYSLRKLTVGVASVLLGVSVSNTMIHSVHAENNTISVISNKKIIDAITFDSSDFEKIEEGVTIPSGNVTVESGTNVELTNTEFRTEVQKLVNGNWVNARDIEQRYQANGVYRLFVQMTTPMKAANGYVFNTTAPNMTLNGLAITNVQWGVAAPTQETEQANFIGYTENITVSPKAITVGKNYSIRYENLGGTTIYKTTGTTEKDALTSDDLVLNVNDLKNYDIQTTGIDLTVQEGKEFVVRVTPKTRVVQVPYEVRYVDGDSRVIYTETKQTNLESTVLSVKANGVVTEIPKSADEIAELADYTLVDTQEKTILVSENGHENVVTFMVKRTTPTTQVTVTYHANKMRFGYETRFNAGTGQETYTETLNVVNENTSGNITADTNRLLGKYNERKSDDNGSLNQTPRQYEHERLAPGELARMTHGWDTGSRFEALLGLAKMYRFVGWNTKPDGTGVWYGPGQALTGDVPENLTLYAQFSNLMDMLEWGSTTSGEGLNKATPSIYLNGSKEHTTKDTAYVATQPEGVSYKADLNFEGIRDEMIVFYNRISRIDNADADETTGIRTSNSLLDIGSGLLKARFSNKLDLAPIIRVRFTSTWITLMNNDELGVSNVRVVGRDADGIRYIYEADVDTSKSRNENGYKYIYLPVDLVSRNVYKDLSFDEFMKPMILSIADNATTSENEEVLGVTGLITSESYNIIANSDDPYIRVGGGIELQLSGDLDMGGLFRNQPLYIKTDAQDQWVRLTPNGQVNFNYEELFTRTKLTEPTTYVANNNQAIDENDSLDGATYSGRSKHHVFTQRNDFDIYNAAEHYIVIDKVLNTQDGTLDRTRDLTTGEVRYNLLGEVVTNHNQNITVPDIDTYTFVGLRDNNGKIYTNQEYAPLFSKAGYTDIVTTGYKATAFDKDITPTWTMIYAKAQLKVNYITLDNYQKDNGEITLDNVLIPSEIENILPRYDATSYKKDVINQDNIQWLHYSTVGDSQVGLATKVVDGVLTAEITHIYITLKTKEVTSSENGEVVVRYVELGNHDNVLKDDRTDALNVVNQVKVTIEYYIDENGQEVEVNRTVEITSTNERYNTDEENENPLIIEKDGVEYILIGHDSTSNTESGLLEVGKKIVVYEYAPIQEEVMNVVTESGEVIVRFVKVGDLDINLAERHVNTKKTAIQTTTTTRRYYMHNGIKVYVGEPMIKVSKLDLEYDINTTIEVPSVIEHNGIMYRLLGHYVGSATEKGSVEVGIKEVVYEYVPVPVKSEDDDKKQTISQKELPTTGTMKYEMMFAGVVSILGSIGLMVGKTKKDKEMN